MTQHGLIKHCSNYYYIRLEDDYLVMHEIINKKIQEKIDTDKETLKEEYKGKNAPGPADCKAMITSVLEHWMNSKRIKASSEDDLWCNFTNDEWILQLRGCYKRTTVIQCLKEMIEDGIIKIRDHTQNTHGYLLNIPIVQDLLNQLPAQSPYAMKPKPALGRPAKYRTKTDGINLNRTKTDGIMEIPSENGRYYEEYRTKTDGEPYKNGRYYSDEVALQAGLNAPIDYTQITNTQITNTPPLQPATTPNIEAIASTHTLSSSSSSLPEETTTREEEVKVVAPTPATDKPAKPTRKPSKPKIDADTQKRIDHVYEFFSKLGQEATKKPDFAYGHTQKATDAIVAWLKTNPTEAILREVYFELWNSPKDARSGFEWKANMNIHSVLNQYTTRSMAIQARRNQQEARHVVIVPTVPYQPPKEEEDELVFIGPASARRKSK